LQEDQQSDLFSYTTNVSLRAAEHRSGTPLLLLVLVLALTAAAAALALAGIVWLASTDFAVLLAALREFVISATRR
jgi:hypothetical protein